jgi:hypothetical protein
VAAPDLKQDSNRNLNQNSSKPLEIHIFRTMSPKITINIPLESLEHVESISALIIHMFSIQFESIFKLNQTHLLAYLIHIVCSVHPKITNL